MKPTPIAVLVSDLHLSLKAPIARSPEDDWMEAQRRPLKQLRKLCRKYEVPCVIAGDLFHHWKSAPELINFAYEELPPSPYVIPGQHDLPFHSYADMHKSAFGTLVKTKRVNLIPPGKVPYILTTPSGCPDLFLHAFPWGFDITPNTKNLGNGIHLAVIHAYCWQKGAAYPGAPNEQRAVAYREKLRGYNAALFGDNHKPFLTSAGGCTVFNHGGFQRRNSDERNMQPAFGLLMSNGDIELVPQDVSEEKWLPRSEATIVEEETFKMEEFLKELEGLGQSSVNFTEALQHYFNTYKVSEGAKRILLKQLESHEA